MAYRYLSGVPLSADEIEALGPKPPQQVEPPKGLQPGGPPPVMRWLAQRTAVAGFQPVAMIYTDRTTMTGGRYVSFPNCLDDAFNTASATLAERIASWGKENTKTAEWLQGQDQVFANCEGDAANQPHVPPALPAGSDPLLLADPQYQIAAAAFYAGRYSEAEERFREVAANAASPWRESAPYLAARALIRKGTVDDSADALVSAEWALRAVIDDPRQKRWHEPAEGLLDFVEARLHREDRLVKLGAALSKPGLGAGIAQAMTDYTAIWDSLRKGSADKSGLADWNTAFQSGDEQHAVERWREGGGTPWLAAALVWAGPAYATVAYHGIRLLVARGEADAARRWADEALAARLPADAQNSFRAERLSLARDWTEFLRYAPRRPVAATAVGADEDISGYPDMASPAPTFDRDAADALNREVPLDLWVDASRNPILPPGIEGRIAQAGWVRAVLLNRAAQARTLARRTAEMQPDLAEGMRAYEAEGSPDAAKFQAVFLMLRTPGLVPVVRAGFGRRNKAGKLDEFGDNWWKLDNRIVPRQPGSPPAAVGFLTEAQRAEGEKEWEALVGTAGTGPSAPRDTDSGTKAPPHTPGRRSNCCTPAMGTRNGPRRRSTGIRRRTPHTEAGCGIGPRAFSNRTASSRMTSSS